MNQALNNLYDLNGKTAIVTGGAMGIGGGIAKRLAEAGASIFIADIVNESEAKITLDEIREKGGKVTYLQVDLTQMESIDNVIEKTLVAYGDIDILVNNAGIFKYLPVTYLTEELWDKTINLNLKALTFLTKAVVNIMISKKHGGRIINISSVDSLKPSGYLAIYDASKGGVRMVTRSFAKEVGKYGITVNDIAPGGINTPGASKIMGDNVTPEEINAMKAGMTQFINTLPLQRMGEPEDIANAALFLASSASAYMTGSTMLVDGGLMLM
ncbi:MAG: glucose 1-dehydrogenase [bacterium]|nr:glucose 1-dehydrogenase [bacterium]